MKSYNCIKIISIRLLRSFPNNFSRQSFSRVWKTIIFFRSLRLLSIMVHLNKDIVRTDLRPSSIYHCSNSFSNPFGTVQWTQTTIGIILTPTFHNWFSSLTKYKNLCFHFFLTEKSAWMTKFARRRTIFFLFCWLSHGLVFWSVFDDIFPSQNLSEYYASYFLGLIMHKPFRSMLKIQSLAPFPGDYSSHLLFC